jgi:hypothetical protein
MMGRKNIWFTELFRHKIEVRDLYETKLFSCTTVFLKRII